MKGIRLAAAAAVAGAIALGVIGSAFAADKAKGPRYFVYKSDQGCSIVMDPTKETAGKKVAGPFKAQDSAKKRMAKMTKEKKC
jgi:hypothetical protein